MGADNPPPTGSAKIPPERRIRTYPATWYPLCPSRQVGRTPATKSFLSRRLVAYRTATGRVVVMDARCSHMGSDLGRGKVVGDAIQCAFHGWEYGPDGRCIRIPAQATIPNFACQVSYPVVERHGIVFVFNGREPLFPLPFFFGCDPKDLIHANSFTAVLDCPWYMIGANAVDLQHFRCTHDRRLAAEPVVDYPDPFAFRTTVKMSVAGRSITDRLTRWFAGDEVTMEMTDWSGTLMLVQATFRRTRSFGLLASLPLDANRTRAYVTIFVRRSRSRLRQTLYDPANVRIRRFFIKKFLSADINRLAGTRYNSRTLIEIDGLMAKYFEWLAALPNVSKGAQAAGSPASGSDSVDSQSY